MSEQRGSDYGCVAVIVFLIMFLIGIVVIELRTEIRDLQRRIAVLEQERR